MHVDRIETKKKSVIEIAAWEITKNEEFKKEKCWSVHDKVYREVVNLKAEFKKYKIEKQKSKMKIKKKQLRRLFVIG